MPTHTPHSRPGAQTIVRSISFAGKTLRKQLWMWPLIAAVLLGIVGWQVRRSVEQTMRLEMVENLQAILRTDVAALNLWYRNQMEQVRSVAADDDIQDAVAALLRVASDEFDLASMLQSPELGELRAELDPWIEEDDGDESGHFHGFILVDAAGRVIAAERNDIILLANGVGNGQYISSEAQRWIERAMAGETLVTPPFAAQVAMTNAAGEAQTGLPTMFALSPVKSVDGEAIATLGLRIRPEEEFTEILSLAHAGESGETYAFDRTGLLLSQSRFDDDLKRIGLLRDISGERSILNLELRDPGVDMTIGLRPAKLRSEQPLTRMVASAAQEESGVDVDGYNDYRGVPVIGAWTWLSAFDIGVASEIDLAEAYQTLNIVRRTFWGMFALLAASAVGIFVYMLVASKWQHEARVAAIEARQLGQYQLNEEIGAGGMGVVYRAHHSLLQRPTAVKLLNADQTNEHSIARFEREVQMTSQLNHPNTIAIYDYGRTPEGVFYYAMEYLDGMPLDDLIDRFGPMPENRAIHVLLQICGSLGEAHDVGLIHRDVKPANIMLNRRGGMFDVVKVLDFGLVKAVDAKRQVTMTAAGAIAGTPQYMPPESIETPELVDARSDIYAIGAVGYYLLTGEPVFDGETVMEVCMKQVNSEPVSISQRTGRPICAELEAAVMQCLQKERENRPANVRQLAEALSSAPVSPWTREDARSWWDNVVDRGAATVAPTGDKRGAGAGNAARDAGETVMYDQSGKKTV